MKILVTGATGNVGLQLAPRLLEGGHTVRVLTRSPYKLRELAAKVEVADGSLADPECLAAAFAGVDAVFLLTPAAQDESQQGLNGVAEAQRAGLERIVYMTIYKAQEYAEVPQFGAKIPVKDAVRRSGLPYTFLEPTHFFQTDLWIEDPLRMFSIYPQPLGGVGVSRVDIRDVADAAVKVLTESGHAGKSYTVAGPDALTGERCAGIWSTHLGREIQYIGDDLDNWETQAEVMMPPQLAHDLRIMYERFHRDGLVATEDELRILEALLGRKPRSFDSFAAEVARRWR